MAWRESLGPLMESLIEGEEQLSASEPSGISSLVFGSIIQDYDGWKTDYYPPFPQMLRERLNNKIEERFYFREVSEEEPIPGRFFHFLRRKLNEVLPKYMYLYELELQDKIDILNMGRTINNTSIEQEGSAESNQSGSRSSASNYKGKGRSVFSEYPQAQISGSADYASNATDVGDQSENTDSETQALETNSSNTNSETRSNITENEGYSIDLIANFINSYSDTDILVLDELEVCFRSMINKPMNQI